MLKQDGTARKQWRKIMELEPIGIIHTPFDHSSGTPIQPAFARDAEGSVDLLPRYAAGLADLASFDRIWLLYWFDRAAEVHMTVTPYRDTRHRGLFATRAPARPNPIGLSCVRLLAVEGHRLKVADVDMLDGTPLVDIKPYVPAFDVYPGCRAGWLDAGHDTRLADGRFHSRDS